MYRIKLRHEELVRLSRHRNVYMQRIFLNDEILRKLENKWKVDMQLHAYIRSLTNNSVQYK